MSDLDEARIVRTSHPVFDDGHGVLMWDAPADVRLIVQFSDESDHVDLTETLGEIVAAGWDVVGEETGVLDEDPEQVAAVTLQNNNGSERFYMINVATRKTTIVPTVLILRAVAVAVRGLLLDGIEQDRNEPEV